MAKLQTVKTAKKWIRTEADKEAIRQGYYFDTEAAEFACGFIEKFCRHPAESAFAGEPFLLLEWERDFVSRLYGWKRSNGYRRFREAYLEVAKKNGKSALFSALGLLGMIDESGAKVYQGAVDLEQASIVFDAAVQMVKSSPDLSVLFRVRYSPHKEILWSETNARLSCMSSDIPSKDGANSSMTIIDEIHRLTGTRRAIYDIMKMAGRARKQPLLLSLTTAGYDRKSLCWELHIEAQRILDGATDNLRFLGVIYAASEDDDLDDPRVWRKANPSMGAIIDEADFAEEWAEAKRIPGRLNLFKRLSFNIWTAAETRWLPLDLWDAAADPAEFRWWADGRPVHAALDLSSVKDLTSLTLANLDQDILAWQSYYFMPADTARERSDRDKVPYDRWIVDGHMLETPGNATDFEAIRQKLNDLKMLGVNIVTVGIDPWNAAHLASLLIEDGFDVVMIRQKMHNFAGPCKEVERRLLNQTLAHDDNPVTRWCVENCAVTTDAQGNMMPAKNKSAERIDGVVSGVMAVGLATSKIKNIPGIVVV